MHEGFQESLVVSSRIGVSKRLALRRLSGEVTIRAMRRSRLLIVVLAGIIGLIAAWLWWVKPSQVDMSMHAPANSLLYLEANRPLEVVKALEATEAWKIVNALTESQQSIPSNPWIQSFVGWTGIGPVESVILARAQVAVVVTELGATEESETLRVKPEGVLIIETKTSERRIRPAVEKAVKKLAELTYGKPVLRTTTIDGVNFIEWISPEGSRQIVTAIQGSLVIIGNTERAVQSCLTVSQGHGPSLTADAELNRVRSELGGATALSFGYVPATNSARLLSIGVPLLMGRAPGNSEFQRLVSSGASKIFGSLGWSSRPFKTGIEDRFLISLRPAILDRLKPFFTGGKLSNEMLQILPADVHSVTYYKFENPATAWRGLKSSVSSQVDALSAVFFSSVFNSSLGSYGIDAPEQFLETVGPAVATLRLDQNAERSLLIARVTDPAKLRGVLNKTLKAKVLGEEGQLEILEDSRGEFSAGFVNGFIVMGSPADVRRYAGAKTANTPLDGSKQAKLTFFVAFTSHANIVTYADDIDRVRSFVSAIRAAKGAPTIATARVDEMLNALPYAATETSLGGRGLERTTFSPLGQFSTLLPLLIPADRSKAAP